MDRCAGRLAGSDRLSGPRCAELSQPRVDLAIGPEDAVVIARLRREHERHVELLHVAVVAVLVSQTELPTEFDSETAARGPVLAEEAVVLDSMGAVRPSA